MFISLWATLPPCVSDAAGPREGLSPLTYNCIFWQAYSFA